MQSVIVVSIYILSGIIFIKELNFNEENLRCGFADTGATTQSNQFCKIFGMTKIINFPGHRFKSSDYHSIDSFKMTSIATC